jgi:L-threonylcarbamoyladenylate synthase
MASEWQVHRVARLVRAGGVIAYPTEAVWGLGCDPWNAVAVERLLALKGRDPGKGLILVAAALEQFDFLLDELPERWLDRLASTWPGPHTWLVPHRQRLPAWITGAHETVALRVSDHPLVRRLCEACGPLVSTSANPAGRPPARSRLRVQQYFAGQLDGVLCGALGGRRNPSTIRDLATAAVVRPA